LPGAGDKVFKSWNGLAIPGQEEPRRFARHGRNVGSNGSRQELLEGSPRVSPPGARDLLPGDLEGIAGASLSGKRGFLISPQRSRFLEEAVPGQEGCQNLSCQRRPPSLHFENLGQGSLVRAQPLPSRGALQGSLRRFSREKEVLVSR